MRICKHRLAEIEIEELELEEKDLRLSVTKIECLFALFLSVVSEEFNYI